MISGEPLLEGHLLDGRYRVRKIIGTGGMGRVYLSNDTRLASRPVAVKEMILGDGIAEKKAIEDFSREATVLARLTHPGIPTLIDHFAENGRHYLVMEFVAGGTLEDALSQAGGKFPEARALLYGRQILEVLDFLHRQTPPIIYRDIKPGNIMISKDGRAMLIDFGIARFLPRGGKATMIGSPGYAPPEQYVGKVEPRSDLYALAATMHHLLSGRDPTLEPPFSFPPLRSIAPQISQQTADAIDRALSHKIEKRFASAREMLDALPIPSSEEISPTAATASTNGDNSLMSMRTVVLTNPVPPPAAAVTPVSSTSSAPTRGRLAAPTPSVGGAKPPNPSVKKAIDLGIRARALIERGLKSKLVSAMIPPAGDARSGPVPGDSSTAKTRELKPVVQPSRIPAPASTAKRPPAPTASRAARISPPRPRTPAPKASPLFTSEPNQKPSGAPARMVARGESIEFAINSVHVTIGRSRPADRNGVKPDIDLAGLKRGAERVSHTHAEIVQRDGEYYLRDLGSLNGTYIAGLGRLGRDQLYKLKDRDQVVLGGAILQFRRG